MQLYKANEIPRQTEDCLLVPSALLDSNRYRDIGPEAIILYAHLLEKSGLAGQAGPEPATVRLSGIDMDGICRAIIITRHKTARALKKLTDAGLVILDSPAHA